MVNLSDVLLSHISIIKSQSFDVKRVYCSEERGLSACRASLAENSIEFRIISARVEIFNMGGVPSAFTLDGECLERLKQGLLKPV